MKLYAAGFNPWGQLAFDEQGIQNEPKDIQSFQVILEGCNIDVVTCRLSYTLGMDLSKPTPSFGNTDPP